MPSQLELISEAGRRGILPPDKQSLYQEAVKRGLIANGQEITQGEDAGPARAALQGFNSAVPFGERLVAGLGALGASAYTGENVFDLYNEARANQKTTETANPNAYFTGGMTGVAATLPIGFSKAVSTTPLLGSAANALQKTAIATGNFVRGSEVAANAGKLAKAANLAGRSVRSAAVAAPTAAIYGYGSGEEGKRLENAASNAGVAASIGAALPAAGAGLGLAASAITPKIAEGLQPVVELAKKYKIPVSLSQVTSGNAVKNLQKVTKELPFSGEANFRENQLKKWQRVIIKTTGGNSNIFTPELMDNLFTKVGKEFDDLGRGKTFKLWEPGEIKSTPPNDPSLPQRTAENPKLGSSDFNDSINSIRSDAERTGATNESLSSFDKVVNDIRGNADAKGNISGEKLGQLRTRINRLARKSNNNDTQELLHDLENALIDTMTSGDNASTGAFSATKQRYKNLLVLEPLAQKAKGGFISPSQLQARVSKIYKRQFTRGKAGEIGDLARIGYELLPELGGSDTTQKSLYVLGAGNAIINPSSIPFMATALTAGRAFQTGVNRNQSLVNTALKNSRKAIPNNAPPQLMRQP